MSKKKQHTHQYYKVYQAGIHGLRPTDKIFVWGCALPECTHYMPHNVEHQVPGKLSLCNRCMEVFQLNEENMKLDKPICDVCTNPDDIIRLPDDFDFERHEAKSFIAAKTGKALEDVTEEEIDKMIQLRRLVR